MSVIDKTIHVPPPTGPRPEPSMPPRPGIAEAEEATRVADMAMGQARRQIARETPDLFGSIAVAAAIRELTAWLKTK